MQKTYEFLLENKPFFMLTAADGVPAGRPFGAIMHYEGSLYIATSKKKDVWAQIVKDPALQLVAIKHGTREWVRVNARAEECTDPAVKAQMFVQCPVLSKNYTGPDDEKLAVIRLADASALYCTDAGKVPMD